MKQTYSKLVIFVLFVGLLLLMNTTEAFAADEEKLKNAWNAFIMEYRYILGVFTGIGTLSSVLVFMIHMIQLGKHSANPTKRKETITNIMISLICTALLGGLSILVTLFYEVILL